MATKRRAKHPGRAGNLLSLAPLAPDQALRAALQISKSDVQAILAESGGKRPKAKRKK
jgi:hypothetical protein